MRIVKSFIIYFHLKFLCHYLVQDLNSFFPNLDKDKHIFISKGTYDHKKLITKLPLSYLISGEFDKKLTCKSLSLGSQNILIYSDIDEVYESGINHIALCLEDYSTRKFLQIAADKAGIYPLNIISLGKNSDKLLEYVEELRLESYIITISKRKTSAGDGLILSNIFESLLLIKLNNPFFVLVDLILTYPYCIGFAQHINSANLPFTSCVKLPDIYNEEDIKKEQDLAVIKLIAWIKNNHYQEYPYGAEFVKYCEVSAALYQENKVLPKWYYSLQEILLEKFKQNLLLKEIIENNNDAANKLFETGVSFYFMLEDGTTPLIVSSLSGNIYMVDCLVNLGAHINHQNSNNNTALIAAITSNNIEISLYLLSHGAKPNLNGDKGFSPLMFAAKHSTCNMINLLINYGADVNYANKQGLTAFLSATFYENEQSLDCFLVLYKQNLLQISDSIITEKVINHANCLLLKQILSTIPSLCKVVSFDNYVDAFEENDLCKIGAYLDYCADIV